METQSKVEHSSIAHRSIQYGQRQIDFDLEYSDRKHLDITVHPNQKVTVKAPNGSAPEKVDQRVKEKVRWILKQQRFFNQFEPRTPPRRYVGGETHLYLGRQYRLKLHQADQSSVKLISRYIHIATPTPQDADVVQALLEAWYLHRARIKFSERLDCCFSRFERMGYSCPNLMVRKLSKRWGSLSPAGNLLLNRDLIRAPRICIDYVLTHELCHLKHPDHSAAFYSFLESVMPDWEARKTKLERLLV